MALALAAAQVERSAAAHGAADAGLGLLQRPLRGRRPRRCWPTCASAGREWPGPAAVGMGVLASGVEYFDEPALVLMLCQPAARAVPRLFRRAAAGAASRPHTRAGARRPGHARPGRADRRDEPAHRRGYLFGGLAASRSAHAPHRRRRVRRAACRAWPSRATWHWSRASRRAASRSARCARVTRGRAQRGARRSTASRRCDCCCATCSSTLDEPRSALPRCAARWSA